MFFDDVKQSSDYISSKISIVPEYGVILGSGLGKIVDLMEDTVIIPYSEIPNFPQSELEGHAGNLVIGKMSGKNILVMQGRFHYYEGFTMKQVTFPVYVMKLLGVSKVIITNACGAINETYSVGDMMIIDDYINFLGDNSLIGPNDERFGPRFPDMSEPYDKKLISLAEKIAKNLKYPYQKGVFALFSGPCYESRAEIRAYKAMGADTVGMSTVPETIAANYLGMKVLGIACITNMATGISKTKHSHEEVLRVANRTGEMLGNWLVEIVKSI